MSDHADRMNALLRGAAGRGRFTVSEAETSPGSAAMNRILRGEQPPAPEPEAEPEPAWHDGDASAGLGQRIPRPEPSMDDLIRGHRRYAQSERAAEADAARLEREQSRDYRTY